MNIFVRELKANLRSLLIWGVIVILFVTIGAAKFSAYEGNPEMLAMLNDMPRFFWAHVYLFCVGAVGGGGDVGQRHHFKGRA
jgi:hypothetical protein